LRLLLTSSGIANQSIAKALLELTQKPFHELRLAFIPTAANIETGNKGWLIQDLIYCKNQGFRSIDIIDISALPRSTWEPRIMDADIVMCGGGNTYYLMHWLNVSGLAGMLHELLKTRVYVGTSAGSIVTTPSLALSSSDPGDYKNERSLGLVGFHVRPHLNTPRFPQYSKEQFERFVKELRAPIYAIDDQTAITVVDGKREVVSEGNYLVFNP
jgi:dipeptidase E